MLRSLVTTVVLVLVLLLALATSGCKSLKSGARESFARKYSCPEDRVEIAPRKELRAADLLLPKTVETLPADEIKNDPGRLQKWRDDRAAVREQQVRLYERYEVFAATGCDKSALVCCQHPIVTSGGTTGEATDRTECVEAPAPK
jgi:hypothetical protein